jgi:hypothetical protein
MLKLFHKEKSDPIAVSLTSTEHLGPAEVADNTASMTAEEVTALLNEITPLVQRREHLMNLGPIPKILLTAIMIVLALKVGVAAQMLFVAALYLYLIPRLFPSRRERQLLARLVGCTDIRAIPALWGGRIYQWRRTRLLYSVLAQLLFRVRESDAPLFTDAMLKEMSDLVLFAGKRWNPKYVGSEYYNLVLAIAQALGYVGGEYTLAQFTQLETRHSDNAVGRSIRDAVTKALPILRERIERRRAGEGLLRASSAGSASPAELVRAATEHCNAHDPTVLVRPAVESDSPPGQAD